MTTSVGLLGSDRPVQLLAELFARAELPITSAAVLPPRPHPLVLLYYRDPRMLARIWPHYLTRWPAGTYLVQCGPQPAHDTYRFAADARSHGLIPIHARLAWDTTQLYCPLAARRMLTLHRQRPPPHPVAQRTLEILAALPPPQPLTARSLSTVRHSGAGPAGRRMTE